MFTAICLVGFWLSNKDFTFDPTNIFLYNQGKTNQFTSNNCDLVDENMLTDPHQTLSKYTQ